MWVVPVSGTTRTAGGGLPDESNQNRIQPMPRSKFLKGPRILPGPLTGGVGAADLIDQAFLSYNGGRLREGCRLFNEKMLAPDCTVGMSLTGALTPAGLGLSCLIPLIEAGFVDWIVSTGANLYHDAHFGLGMELRQGSAAVDDVALREEGVVRIYDVFFDYEVLLDTDRFFRELLELPEFGVMMSSAEFHYRVGRYLHEREKALGQGARSLLSAAWSAGVPVYTSSPGDSSIGMNVAERWLRDGRPLFDVSADVNETAAIVWDAKRAGRSAVLIVGGGSPKNFMLQTEPQIQEVLGLDEKGHDYFLQVTDARPDTGGLSGATPSEAVSWGKIDPGQLPDTVVCYTDATIGLPLLTAYALSRHEPRPLRRLYDRREELLDGLREAYRGRRGQGA